MPENRYKKKINLLGDAAVGKTSLIIRFVKNIFGEKYLKTVGTNVYNKDVFLTGFGVKLVIFDIMGESGYENVQETAFRGSSGALAVADFTRKKTLDNLINHWVPKYKNHSTENLPIFLAINKYDLEDKEISGDIIEDISKHFNCIYFTSAKTTKNVDEIFRDLAFRTVYQSLSPVRNVEDVIYSKSINSSKELMGALLTYASELGNMDYSTKERLLMEAGIDKFSLEEEIPEEDTIEFGKKLAEWYIEDKDKDSAKAIKKVIDKYRKKS